MSDGEGMPTEAQWLEGNYRGAREERETTDLAATIRAKVTEARETTPWSWPSEFEVRMCGLADAILARHQGSRDLPVNNVLACQGCLVAWPCPDVRDLAAAWGVEP